MDWREWLIVVPAWVVGHLLMERWTWFQCKTGNHQDTRIDWASRTLTCPSCGKTWFADS